MASATNQVRVIGVHRVPADEPVHLVEISISEPIDKFDFGDMTKESRNQARANWQSSYDEREVGRDSAEARFAFFFHYMDLTKPLLTSFGPVELPVESSTPEHLREIVYEAP